MNHLFTSTDARETKQWANFLTRIGWITETVGKTNVFIKRMPFIGASAIKIQHQRGPFPFKQIEKIARKYKAFYVLVEPHIVGYNEKDFRKNGYQPSKEHFAHTATMKIDLTPSLEKIRSSFSESARRNIKKAQKNNLKTVCIAMKDIPDKDETYLRQFHELSKHLAHMKKFYIPDYNEHVQKLKAFKKNVYLYFAYEEGSDSPIATVWYTYFNHVLAYFQTGITNRGYELGANYLLVWKGIELAKKRGAKVLDFEAVFDTRYPHEHPSRKGYTEFKSRFHPTLVQYPPTWHKFYSIPFKIIYSIGTIFHR
jgi:lipid II:glycine glycyltransferase (peptidoglycan interpeptide bridge formation enzyme)